MLKEWRTAFLDLIYPPKCPVCLSPVSKHGAWCGKCRAEALAPREINLLSHHLAALDSCMAVCDYTSGLKKIIHDMKYRHAGHYGKHLSWLLAEGLRSGSFVETYGVVPVPLHARRLAERGYNQTERIFKAWAEGQGFIWLEALARVRPTVPQWELQRRERQDNVKGAFIVTRPEAVAGKHILLVDDILTSGMTMNECAKVLKKAGAARVAGLALASGAVDGLWVTSNE